MNKKLMFALLAGTFLAMAPAYADEVIEEIEIESIEVMPKRFDKEYHQAKAMALANRLNLTEEQKLQAERIREEGHKKIAPLMDQMLSLRQKIDEQRRANMQEFETILTPEQKADFETIKAKAPRFGQGPRHEGEGKMMRGLHQFRPDHEKGVRPDRGDFRGKHHKKIKDKKHHKDFKKGGFVDDENVYLGGGFVEKQ